MVCGATLRHPMSIFTGALDKVNQSLPCNIRGLYIRLIGSDLFYSCNLTKPINIAILLLLSPHCNQI